MTNDVRTISAAPASSTWTGSHVCLEDIGGTIAVCTLDGVLVGATPSARTLLSRLGVVGSRPPAPLPQAFWEELARTPVGEATEWHPPAATDGACLGCTRYALGSSHVLLLMREVSQKQTALRERLHRQRLEITGRLVATIAHDLRAPLSSIVFNCDVLSRDIGSVSEDRIRVMLAEMTVASTRLRRAIDGLLDFARLGPPLNQDVSLRDVADRVASLLRPSFRGGENRLSVHVDPAATWVRGNALVIEQILMNLVLNALEAARGPITIDIATEPLADSRGDSSAGSGRVALVVADDGPGVPAELGARIFEPFFTTKPGGTGLGLTSAREAAQELGGELRLDSGAPGARFVVVLVAGAEPKAQPEGAE